MNSLNEAYYYYCSLIIYKRNSLDKNERAFACLAGQKTTAKLVC